MSDNDPYDVSANANGQQTSSVADQVAPDQKPGQPIASGPRLNIFGVSDAPAEANTAAPIFEVGAFLRRVREQADISLQQVAQDLKLRSGHLRAIEEGLFEALPERAYLLGYVKTYANYLNLDAEQVIIQFKAELGEPPEPQSYQLPEASPPARLPRWSVRVIMALIAFLLAIGVYFYASADSTISSFEEPLPPRLKAFLQDDAYGTDGAIRRPSQPVPSQLVPAQLD